MRLKAQDQGDLNPTTFNVAPAGPNAAALGKYGDIEVNLFNGLPNISVPLGKIVVGNEFSQDLSLSYHASGNRVNDVSTFVGLGWSLNAGGVITRLLRGNPDENGYADGQGKRIPLSVSGDITPDTYQTFNQSATGLIDTQPDEFFYNVGGYSGKFVIDTNRQVRLLPYKDIKITLVQTSLDGTSFNMITPDGTQYIFHSREQTEILGCSDNDLDYVSAWYVTQIILPGSKRTINFTYVADQPLGQTIITQTKSSSTSSIKVGYSIPGCPGIIPVLGGCTTNRNIMQIKISQIDYPGGRITFDYNYARTDITNGSYALTGVTFASNVNGVYKTIDKYLLNYTTASRMLLNKVSNADTLGNAIKSYAFTYNSVHLPAVNSFSQDHWGYYNGASNPTLIPSDSVSAGGNREPNASYTNADILQTITYPTGGVSTFDFENNVYGHYGNSQVVNDPIYATSILSRYIVTGYTSSTVTNPDEVHDSLVLSLNYAQYVKSDAVLTAYNGNIVELYIRDMSTGAKIQVANGVSYIPLDSGLYHIILSSIHSEPTATAEHVSINLTYNKLTGFTSNATGGGLRVKKITNYDGVNHANDIIKSYTYTFSDNAALSSGYLTNRPVYTYSFTSMRPTPDEGNSSGTDGVIDIPCNMTIKTSSANNEIESGGGSVVYKEILETDNLNGSTRYIYQFSNNVSGINVYPFGPNPDNDPAKGMLNGKYVYDNTGKLKVRTINQYTTFKKADIIGWKPGYRTKGYHYIGYPWEHFSSNFYTYFCNGALLSKSTVTQFEGTDSLSTVTDYYYDNMNHIQPTRIHKVNSKGDDVWTYKTYPTDYTIPSGTLSSGLQALKQMQDSNIHNVVIEQYVQQIHSSITTTLAGSSVRYKVVPATTGTQVVMDTAFMLKRSAPLTSFTPAYITGGVLKLDANYEPRVTYNVYDSVGNIREQGNIYDRTEAYIWGYNNLYPVAKVVGTTYNTAVSYVNMNVIRNPGTDDLLRAEINKIRTNLAGSNVLVTTYTFRPELGESSEVDPSGRIVYYEYDLMGRLRVIKDENGKILKQFSYQYSRTITQ